MALSARITSTKCPGCPSGAVNSLIMTVALTRLWEKNVIHEILPVNRNFAKYSTEKAAVQELSNIRQFCHCLMLDNKRAVV